MILQKYIAQSGYCSRREAESLIRAGRVRVNGLVAELGQSYGDGDKVMINDREIGAAAEKIFILLNKPRGYTCTTRQFEGEKNVFELIDQKQQGLNIVGRLDKDSRGLVILTNDGGFVYEMTHPKYEHEKEYVVTISDSKFISAGREGYVSKQISQNIIAELMAGVDIGDGDGVVRAKNVKYIGDNKFIIILTEGKKRQIRRMFEAIGLQVIDLLRVRIGDYELDSLEEGTWMILNKLSKK